MRRSTLLFNNIEFYGRYNFKYSIRGYKTHYFELKKIVGIYYFFCKFVQSYINSKTNLTLEDLFL